MVVDPRRDHSFRVPRPDLSVKIGTPNACTGCHLEMEQTAKGLAVGTMAGEPGASAPGGTAPSKEKKVPITSAQGEQTLPQRLPGTEGRNEQPDYPLYYADFLELARTGDKQAAADIARLNEWSSTWTEKWYGPLKDKEPHFALALDAAWRQQPGAEQMLVDVARRKTEPPMVRATALSRLGQYEGTAAVDAVTKALSDPDPLVRAMAVGAAAQQRDEPESRVKGLAPLLKDPIRLVRVEAARALAPFLNLSSDAGGLTDKQRDLCRNVLNEYRQGQLAEKDQAAAQTNLGSLSEQLGNDQQAVAAYETAIRLDPGFFPAQFRLALLSSRLGRKERTEQLLRNIVKQAQSMTDPQRLLTPVIGEAHYMLGLLLKEFPDRVDEAEKELLTADRIEPRQARNAYALATFYLQHSKWDNAERFARQFAELTGNSQQSQELLRHIFVQRSRAP